MKFKAAANKKIIDKISNAAAAKSIILRSIISHSFKIKKASILSASLPAYAG
jgi:hypothetical protein